MQKNKQILYKRNKLSNSTIDILSEHNQTQRKPNSNDYQKMFLITKKITNLKTQADEEEQTQQNDSSFISKRRFTINQFTQNKYRSQKTSPTNKQTCQPILIKLLQKHQKQTAPQSCREKYQSLFQFNPNKNKIKPEKDQNQKQNTLTAFKKLKEDNKANLIEEKSKVIQDLLKQQQQKNQQLKIIKEQLQNIKKQNSNLKNDKKIQQKQIQLQTEKYQQQIQTKDRVINSLETKLKNTQKQFKEILSTIQQLHKDNENKAQQIKAYQNKLSIKQQTLINLQSKEKQLKKKLVQQQKEIQQKTQIDKQAFIRGYQARMQGNYKKLQQKIKDHEHVISQLQIILIQERTKIKHYEKNQTLENKKVQQLQQKIKEKKQINQDLLAQNEQQKIEICNLKKIIDDQKKKYTSRQNEKAQLRGQLKKLQSENLKKNEIVLKLTQKLFIFQNQIKKSKPVYKQKQK